MFSGGKRNSQTLPRSDSEIEIDFARIHNERKAKNRKSETKGHHNKSKRSFSTKNYLVDHASREDTDGSSIIDLRNKRSIQRRSKSLDQLEDSKPSRSSRERDHHGCGRSSLRITPFDSRISFHTSLKDLSSDDQPVTLSNNRRGFPSFDTITQCDPVTGTKGKKNGTKSRNLSSRSRHKSASRITEDHQIILKKASRYNDKFERKILYDKQSSSSSSPSFSFRSSLNLIPSSIESNGLRQQIIVTVTSSLAPLACGFTVPFILTKTPRALITESLSPWAHYIYILGGIVGAILSGVISNIGRKAPMVLAMGFLLSSWISIIFLEKTWAIILFNAISGTCTSLIFTLSQIYVAEISTPKFRGALSTGPLLALHIGILVCYFAQNFMTPKTLEIIGASLTVPFFIMMILCMPESPRFLIYKSPNTALAILQWLRGFCEDVMDEYRDIADSCYPDRWKITRHEIANPSFWRPLLLTSSLMFLYSMSGIGSIAFYCQSLFKEMGLTYHNASLLIFVSLLIFGIILSIFLVDRVGRKLLLLLSLTIMAASAFALGLFLFLKDIHKVETYYAYQWTAETFCIILFIMSHASALGPITWLTLGETFGTRLKWVGISISTMIMWASLLLVEIAFNKITTVIATGGLFWFHCILCVGGYIFILLYFRELRDHKLDDISSVFVKKNENLIDTFITKI